MIPRPAELVGIAAGIALWSAALFGGPSTQTTTAPVASSYRPVAAIPGVELAASSSQEVTGRVVDNDGHPIAGVMVFASPTRGPTGLVPDVDITDADGRFDFADLAPGRYSFVALHGEHPPGSMEAVPVYSGATAELEIVLDQAGIQA